MSIPNTLGHSLLSTDNRNGHFRLLDFGARDQNQWTCVCPSFEFGSHGGLWLRADHQRPGRVGAARQLPGGDAGPRAAAAGEVPAAAEALFFDLPRL